MLTSRTNHEWILALTNKDNEQAEALDELRQLLLRAALFTLTQSLDDLRSLDPGERQNLAEECAQEALVAVLAKLGDFRGESKFTTWVYQFGVNIARTRARQERWKRVSLEELSENADSLDWLQWKAVDSNLNAEKNALKAEVNTAIREIIRKELTSRQRLVLKLIVFDNVPMDVVVERFGSNRNAIYKLLHDARLKVKKKLIARGYDLDEIFNLFSDTG